MSPVTTARRHTTTPEQTFLIGQDIGARLADSLPDGVVVLLVGPLGAGKTVMAKGIALGLGISEQIISPTYTIVSEYVTGMRPLHHVDLYRIEGQDQLENLGLEDILRGNGIVVVEWGEKLALSDGGQRIRVSIALAADGGRDISIEGLPR